MFLTPFMEPPLKGVVDDVKNNNDCLFDAEDSYSEWGLLTPPWSPCYSTEMDTSTDCESLSAAESVAAAPTTRARCDSFLCSCTSCECSESERAEGPVLRDCMWSQTTGLLPPPSLVAGQTSDVTPDPAERKSSGHCVPCCPAITTVCTNHTDRCVDPKNVFPCHTGTGVAKSLCVPSQTALHTVISPDCSVTKSPVYEPDSETSAYCSSFSGLLSAAVCKSRKLFIEIF